MTLEAQATSELFREKSELYGTFQFWRTTLDFWEEKPLVEHFFFCTEILKGDAQARLAGRPLHSKEFPRIDADGLQAHISLFMLLQIDTSFYFAREYIKRMPGEPFMPFVKNEIFQINGIAYKKFRKAAPEAQIEQRHKI